MSDEPSDAQKLIAEVIGGHRYDISDVHVHRCVCGAVIGRDPDALDMHRAAEVDKALGGLTLERSGVSIRIPTGNPCDCGNEAHPSWCETRCARFRVSAGPTARWVSGWTVTE